jgi:Asp-tRNA(Asn)/Glu-tRNA(Gln) amidotransferase A subunit family amidase
VGLAELVRSGEVKPAELLEAARTRADEVNPRINAIVVDVEPTAAVEGAPFSGVPFLIKDLLQHLAGYPTSGGSRSLSAVPATENATVVQRWLDAGLVIFGKTNTPEFGANAVTEPELFGPTRNPWNTVHTPGGSSGGSAAAVAAGIVPCAGASDGGGSIRIPASACGLFGLKASRGLVPAGPAHGEYLGGSATDGVISRSVRDSAAMLDVMVGPTPNPPYLAAQSPDAYLDEVGRAPGRLRIGACTTSSINPKPHQETVAAVTEAADLLTDLGHDVVQIARAPYDGGVVAREFLTTYFAYAAYTVDEAKAASGADDSAFELNTRLMAAMGRSTNPVDLTRALERRHEHVRRLADFHQQYDLLLTPTTATPAPRRGVRSLARTANRRTWAARRPRRRAAAAVDAGSRPDDRRLPRMGAVHAGGEPHRPSRHDRSPALDRRRPADRCPVRRPARGGRTADPPGLAARAGPPVGRPPTGHVRLGPRPKPPRTSFHRAYHRAVLI